MSTLRSDVEYGLRQLRRNPGVAGVAVLALALGTGANTAVFSIVNGTPPGGERCRTTVQIVRKAAPETPATETISLTLSPTGDQAPVQTDTSHAFQFRLSDYRGDYLGLPSPGTTPERFAPGFISRDGRHDHCLIFSPSGRQAMFATAGLDWKEHRLWYLRQIEGRWTYPVELEFSRQSSCFNPIFAADEKRIIFSMVVGKDQFKYYYCDLTDDGYSSAHRLDTPLNDDSSNFSYYSDRAGKVYFCGVRPGGRGGTDPYVLSRRSGAASITPITELSSPLDDDSPFLSTDGKCLVFNRQTKDSQGKTRFDVMFSYRTPSGRWSPPVDYGRHIGAAGWNWRPVITSDGRYLFFSMEGEKGFDVYWVSASVLEELKPKAELSKPSAQASKEADHS